MKRVLLLTTIGVLFCVAFSQAQNVFNPADPIIRYSSGAALGSPQRPDPAPSGMQKWVSTSTSGVSTGNNNFDASSFKAYYINLGGARMSFRLKFPKSYTNPDSAAKKYPIMIFFHGAGEPGCPSNNGLYNNEKQLLHGGKLFRDYVDNNQFDGFLFYPQAQSTTNSCWWEWGIAPHSFYYNLIISSIDSMAKYARADVDKVITTGLSNGGASAWSMAAAYPYRVAKAAPSAAATGANNYADFVHIPTWFASGGKDTNPTPGFASGTYNNIKNAGADITWTLYPDLGHSVWYQHWQMPGFTAWMNDMHKANPLVFFQRNDFCPDSVISTKMGISRGFYEYQWRRNGTLIASAVLTSQVLNPATSLYTYNYNSTIAPGGGTHIISYTANDITVRSYGTYEVRFRRYQNGDWSPWSPKPAVIAQKVITNTPPIALDGFRSKVLPAPDGSTTAPLILPVGYNKYEWYRNDVLVDTGRRFNAIPGAYKAKAYEPFGCGSIFSPVFNVIAANGEPKPDPAINLTATVEDLINIRLKWNQNPNAGENETGFEIYRSTGGAGGPYELLAIAPTDASNYLDPNRASNSTSYYIVRAVGNFGAGAITNEASATTPSDNVAPTAPSNLRATCITRDRVILNWSAASDNVGVAVYDIYINGDKSYSTTKTRFEVYQLSVTQQYSFSVRAKDAAGNSSQPSNQVSAFTKAQGVCYKLYEGDWEFLPDFNSLTPIAEGMIPSVNLNLIPGLPTDHFGVLFEGHMLGTTAEDDHRFRLCSDDGGRFYFNTYYNPNSNGIFNPDGVHGLVCEENTTNYDLNNGQAYPFAVAYFDKTGDDSLRLTWQVRTISTAPYDTIPPAAFTQGGGGGTLPGNVGSLNAATFSYKQINLTWGNIASETGFEIQRATTSAAGPFTPLATVGVDVLAYSDTGLTANTQYWYRVRGINNIGASPAWSPTATATTSAAPPGPAAPTNLGASTPALATVQLTWTDNSTTETGFEIWRSAGNNTTFELLTTIPAQPGTGQRVYVDAPVFANVHYFYKVRAKGDPTPSGYTGEVNASTANTPPVLNQVPDFTVRQGTSVSVAINATDVDGDPMQFIASLPYFATIQPVSNGNANLVVNPPAGEQGGYTLRLIVDDGFGGKDTVKFTIVVNDNQLPVLNPINDVNVNEGDSVVLNLTATDAEMAQYFTWSTKNMPAFGTLTNNGNGSATLKLKPGYAASGIYSMTVIVDDGFGAWTSRTFSIIVNETDPNESIQISMGYFSPPVPLWNIVQLQGLTSWNIQNLTNKKGEVTTVGFRSLTTGGGIAGSDHGMQPGGTGVFPDQIMKTQLKVGYGASNNDQMTMEVYGLDPLKKYNFIFFASDNGAEAWRGYNANTVTTWTINGVNASVRLWQNTSMTDTIYQVSPNAQGRVTIAMAGDPSPNIGSILNALVVEKQFDDNTTPAKPANLQAQVIPNLGVNLQWEDVAYNENSYRVFRSTSLAGPFTALTPDAQRDSVHYLDAALAPYTQYYYFVRGVNHLGMGASSDTVGAVTGNNKPNFNGLGDLIVKTGANTQDDFSVTDDAGDVLTVSIINKPAYITLTSLGGNNYRITAAPTIDNIGWDYVTVQVKDDKGGVRTQDVVVTVADAATRSVYINFGYNVPAPAPWNNIMGFGNVNTTVNNLRDETNTPTPFGVQLVTGWDGVFENGQRTGNNSGVFPDSVLAAGLFDDGNPNMVVRFTGLNPAMRYNIALVGSLNDGRMSFARYSCNGVADTLSARNNSNGTANLNNLTPSAGGVLDVTIQKLAGSIWTVLNGVQIEEYAPPAAGFNMKPLNVFAEARSFVIGQSTVGVNLSWSDRSSNETGFRIERSTDPNFPATSATVGENVNTVGLSARNNNGVTQGLAPNTLYYFRVRANGTSNSDWSNKVKVITPQTSVNINFNFSVPEEANGWNNTNALPNFLNTFSGLINFQNAPTSMSMSIEKIFNGEYAFGIRPGSSQVPDNVMEASYWIDRAQEAQVRLSGLNQDKRYRIGFSGGIDDALFNGEFTMSYTINGRTVYLNSFFNTTAKIVWIGDIVPTESGEIVIVFSTPNRNTIAYGFTSCIIVQSYDDPIGGQSPNVVRIIDQPEVMLQEATTEQPTVSVSTPAAYDARMYPNPFSDQINLDFNNNSAGNNIAVDVYDMSGKLVFRRNYGRLPAGYNTVRLNTAEGKLNTGVYMVTLNVNGKPVQTTKMIKDRK